MDIISAVIDNSDRFQLSMYIQLHDGRLYRVTEANHNDVIRTYSCFCNDSAPFREYLARQ